MSDFATTWNLTRGRFLEVLDGLSQAQINWRIHPNTLSIAEMAVHVAGVEVSFASQLTSVKLDNLGERIRLAATDGVVNDDAFPFSESELTPAFVKNCLKVSKGMVESLITLPTEDVRKKTIKSALGPMINGTGALARLSFHPGYHQGQAYLIRTAPGFPKS